MQFGSTSAFTEMPSPPLRPLPEVESREWRAGAPLEVVVAMWWAMTWRTVLLGVTLAAGFALPAMAMLQLAGVPAVLAHSFAGGIAALMLIVTSVLMLRWLLQSRFYNFRIALMTDPMD